MFSFNLLSTEWKTYSPGFIAVKYLAQNLLEEVNLVQCNSSIYIKSGHLLGGQNFNNEKCSTEPQILLLNSVKIKIVPRESKYSYSHGYIVLWDVLSEDHVTILSHSPHHDYWNHPTYCRFSNQRRSHLAVLMSGH